MMWGADRIIYLLDKRLLFLYEHILMDLFTQIWKENIIFNLYPTTIFTVLWVMRWRI